MVRYYYFLYFLFLILLGCSSNDGKVSEKLEKVDAIIEESPDSALYLLELIDESQLFTSKQKARYALLKSMALDKNYIDTTTFDVLQPAIDFYSKHGSPNEKLRTFYYQGRIYQNASNDEKALKSFIKAEELVTKASDSLTIARLYVAESALYQKQCLYESMINSSIISAKWYKVLKNDVNELESLGHALNGSLIIHDRERADSILVLADSLCDKMGMITESIQHARIIYALDYFDTNRAKDILDSVVGFEDNEIIKMDIAYGNAILGYNQEAIKYWSEIKDYQAGNTMKYLSIGAIIMENNGNYCEALHYLKNYIAFSDSVNNNLMTDNVISTRVQFELEKDALLQERKLIEY